MERNKIIKYKKYEIQSIAEAKRLVELGGKQALYDVLVWHDLSLPADEQLLVWAKTNKLVSNRVKVLTIKKSNTTLGSKIQIKGYRNTVVLKMYVTDKVRSKIEGLLRGLKNERD